MNSQNPWLGSALIVVVGTALGLGYNTLHPRALPWIAQPKTAVTLETLAVPESGETDPESVDSEALTGITSTGTSGVEGLGDAGATPPSRTSPDGSHPGGPDRGRLTGGPAEVPAGRSLEPGNTSRGEASPILGANDYADIPESEYPIEIHLEKAKEFYDRGGMLVFDAREPEEYAEGHILGALSTPADAMAGDLDWLERTAKETRPILVYCGGGECDLSLDLGFELNRAGHRRILVLKEGYPEWKSAGYPVEEGSAP